MSALCISTGRLHSDLHRHHPFGTVQKYFANVQFFFFILVIFKAYSRLLNNSIFFFQVEKFCEIFDWRLYQRQPDSSQCRGRREASDSAHSSVGHSVWTVWSVWTVRTTETRPSSQYFTFLLPLDNITGIKEYTYTKVLKTRAVGGLAISSHYINKFLLLAWRESRSILQGVLQARGETSPMQLCPA